MPDSNVLLYRVDRETDLDSADHGNAFLFPHANYVSDGRNVHMVVSVCTASDRDDSTVLCHVTHKIHVF